MNLPEEFKNRVIKTRVNGTSTVGMRRLNETIREWPGSDIDVIYEELKPVVVVVFASTEDCLAFKLKYGENYV